MVQGLSKFLARVTEIAFNAFYTHYGRIWLQLCLQVLKSGGMCVQTHMAACAVCDNKAGEQMCMRSLFSVQHTDGLTFTISSLSAPPQLQLSTLPPFTTRLVLFLWYSQLSHVELIKLTCVCLCQSMSNTAGTETQNKSNEQNVRREEKLLQRSTVSICQQRHLRR